MTEDFYLWLNKNNVNEKLLTELGHLEKEDLDAVYKHLRYAYYKGQEPTPKSIQLTPVFDSFFEE